MLRTDFPSGSSLGLHPKILPDKMSRRRRDLTKPQVLEFHNSIINQPQVHGLNSRACCLRIPRYSSWRSSRVKHAHVQRRSISATTVWRSGGCCCCCCCEGSACRAAGTEPSARESQQWPEDSKTVFYRVTNWFFIQLMLRTFDWCKHLCIPVCYLWWFSLSFLSIKIR